jgi:hypothetical protein
MADRDSADVWDTELLGLNDSLGTDGEDFGGVDKEVGGPSAPRSPLGPALCDLHLLISALLHLVHQGLVLSIKLCNSCFILLRYL